MATCRCIITVVTVSATTKLAALTVLHNFYVRHPDGTTAAERFFGRAHPALFEQVLAHVDSPPPARGDDRDRSSGRRWCWWRRDGGGRSYDQGPFCMLPTRLWGSS